ncbi:MAG: ComF family protein [Spirosomataceae bacterium]
MGKVPVKAVLTFLKFEKKGKVQRLLHQLKYNNRSDVGQTLGRLYGAELKQTMLHEQLDILLSVPLHPRKLAQRGYNQSDTFAKGLSDSLGVDWSGQMLQRVKFTSTQTQKSRFERFENVAGIFELTQIEKIKGKRIALVDDVLTTGATLESAIATLLENGAKEVSVITIAAAY